MLQAARAGPRAAGDDPPPPLEPALDQRAWLANASCRYSPEAGSARTWQRLAAASASATGHASTFERRDPRRLRRVLAGEGQSPAAFVEPDPVQRPDRPADDGRDAAVRALLPGQGARRLPALRLGPEVLPHVGHRRGRRSQPSHVLRDARQLLDRRLLQGRSHPVGARLLDAAIWASTRSGCGSRSTRPTTRPTRSGSRPASRRSASSGSATSTTGGARPAGAARAVRTPSCTTRRGPASGAAFPEDPPDCDCGRLEFWNLVFMQYNQDENGSAHAAAQAERRHRDGPGARHGRGAGPAVDLRHRPVSADHQGRRAASPASSTAATATPTSLCACWPTTVAA